MASRSRVSCIGRGFTLSEEDIRAEDEPQKPKAYSLRDGMGLDLKIDPRCETRQDIAKGELWLVEIANRNLRSIRLRHLKAHAHLGLSDRCANLVMDVEKKKAGSGWVHSGSKSSSADPCTEFIPKKRNSSFWSRVGTLFSADPSTNGSCIEFVAHRNDALGFQMFVDKKMSTRGVSGRIVFYRRNFSHQRIPLPFPQLPSTKDNREQSPSIPVEEKKEDGQGDDKLSDKEAKNRKSGKEEEKLQNNSEAFSETKPKPTFTSSISNEKLLLNDEILMNMFKDFDENKDGKLSSKEMLEFARRVCNFPTNWDFGKWWSYILLEYAETETDSVLDFQGFKLFIVDRPNKEDICRCYLEYASGSNLPTEELQ